MTRARLSVQKLKKCPLDKTGMRAYNNGGRDKGTAAVTDLYFWPDPVMAVRERRKFL